MSIPADFNSRPIDLWPIARFLDFNPRKRIVHALKNDGAVVGADFYSTAFAV
jgi:hypothetical protein